MARTKRLRYIRLAAGAGGFIAVPPWRSASCKRRAMSRGDTMPTNRPSSITRTRLSGDPLNCPNKSTSGSFHRAWRTSGSGSAPVLGGGFAGLRTVTRNPARRTLDRRDRVVSVRTAHRATAAYGDFTRDWASASANPEASGASALEPAASRATRWRRVVCRLRSHELVPAMPGAVGGAGATGAADHIMTAEPHDGFLHHVSRRDQSISHHQSLS
jgi:hypothetical protein